MKKILNKKGSALILTLCALMFIVTISSAICLASYNAHVATTYKINSQQSYFTARSATAATIEYIQENADDTDAINALTKAEGESTSSSMGDCTVNVSYINNNTIKVLSTATYKGQKSTVSAYLTKSAAPAGIPTDNLIYVNGSGADGFGQCTLNGSVYVNGDFNLGQGSIINGRAIVTGKTSITGAGATTKGLISFGDVTLDNSGTVDGDVKTKGSITAIGDSLITGNANCDGNLIMNSGSGHIKGNATAGGNVSFAGGGYIYGSLSYGGTLTGNASSFVGNGATKISNYSPIDLSSYESTSLPDIEAPSSSENSQLYTPLNPLTNSNKTVSSSGTMGANFLSSLSSLDYGSTVTVDTSRGDISLMLNSNYNVGNGINLEVSGSHNVYIYLTGNSNFDLSANQYVGMHNRGTAPQIYIIGSGNQSVNLTSDSELDAFIYLPNGTFSASGSPLTTYKFIGSCIAKSFDIDSDVKFQYSKPNLSGTPLGGSGSGSGSGSDSWTIERWSDN